MKKSQVKVKEKKEFKLKKLSDLGMAVLKGSLWAMSISLVLILLFAIIIRFTNLDDAFIMPINQIIKVVSLFFGVLFAAKINPKNGLKMGLYIGLIYSVLAFFIFSLLSLSFNFSPTLLVDIIFACLIGGICGIFAVNIKSKNM